MANLANLRKTNGQIKVTNYLSSAKFNMQIILKNTIKYEYLPLILNIINWSEVNIIL